MKADCRAVPGDSRPGVRSGTGSWRLKRAWGECGAQPTQPGGGGHRSAASCRLDSGSKASPGDWCAGHQMGIPGKMLDPKV